MEYKTITKMTTIKRRIEPDDTLIRFIRHNSNKRRYLWNKFVENYNEIGYEKFDPNSVRERLIDEDINDIESREEDDPVRLMYCADIPLAVYKDVKRAIKRMITRFKQEGVKSSLRFKSYDPFRKAFTVRTKNEISNSTGLPRGKVHIKSPNEFEFRSSHDHVKNVFNVHTIEPLVDDIDYNNNDEYIVYHKNSRVKRYSFHHENIKQIIFMEELGKYYIMLVCKVTYYINTYELKSRHEVAGIDLGIHNPVTIYTGNRTIFTGIEPKQISKLRYYERRVSKLKSAMDKKLKINKSKQLIDPSYNIRSKRYTKLRCRYRRYYKRIVNIRRDWRFKISSVLTNTYKTIVVDEFKTPDNRKLNICNKLKRKYNHYNREHAMYLMMEVLRHSALKNGCDYVESPKYTTRTCAICGHKNPKPPLSQRYISCENCGNKMDRDMNAAMNCYDFYFNQNRWLKD